MSQARSGGRDAEGISQSIVTAVASAEGVEPAELTPPLYRVIDPDALERLFASNAVTERHGQVSFAYNGYEVTVDGEGDVSVESLDESV